MWTLIFTAWIGHAILQHPVRVFAQHADCAHRAMVLTIMIKRPPGVAKIGFACAPRILREATVWRPGSLT